MKIDNPFDKKNELYRKNSKAPESVLDAAVVVADNLDICWSIAQSVFEEKATPTDAISIYRLLQEECNLKSDRLQRYRDSPPSDSCMEGERDLF